MNNINSNNQNNTRNEQRAIRSARMAIKNKIFEKRDETINAEEQPQKITGVNAVKSQECAKTTLC